MRYSYITNLQSRLIRRNRNFLSNKEAFHFEIYLKIELKVSQSGTLLEDLWSYRKFSLKKYLTIKAMVFCEMYNDKYACLRVYALENIVSLIPSQDNIYNKS